MSEAIDINVLLMDSNKQTCSNGHPLIEWFNPQVAQCPVCSARRETHLLQTDFDKLKDEFDATRTELRKHQGAPAFSRPSGFCPP